MSDLQQRSDPAPPLLKRLPPSDASADAVLAGFLDAVAEREIELYSAQEEAILELMDGKHVVLNTPTGSGKSLVAEALHFKCLAQGQRSFYTAPIKALVSEKFFALCDQFGADRVGMLTGDASINRDAPIICCTAEILSNMALHEGAALDVDAVVMDEFHYYGDRDRGVAWQIPLLVLDRCTFLLMSATLGDVFDIEQSIRKRSGREVAVVRGSERPVPLDYAYRETYLHETIEELVAEGRAPIYVVNFTQRECAELAQALTSTKLIDREQRKAIQALLADVRFDSPYGKDVRRFCSQGIGVHHAGLLPKYRRLVERLAQDGHLKVICGTDTLGVGVNIPIRSVVFSKLSKYDGEKTAVLQVRHFQQIAGRAGRRGFDEQGSVLAQAPEHVVDNMRQAQKVAAGKKKKLVKRPPPRHFVGWDQKTFERLVRSQPEALRSQFAVSHGMLLHCLQGGAEQQANGYRRLVELIARCHETDRSKHKLRRQAAQIFRSLRAADIISVIKNPQTGTRVVVNTDLQQDFSLNHTLSMYLMEALPRLDPQAPDFALQVLSLVESILESPRVILKAQLDKLFTLRLAELKAQGMDYEERMAELEKLEHPKPCAEFIYDSFNAFAHKHPWIGSENIKPKSIARELYERGMTFHDYVREYGLARAEGVLLRYLSGAYKTLVQNVPEALRDDSVVDAIAYLRAVLVGVDASLLEEWEQLASPALEALPEPDRQARAARRQIFDPEANPRVFQARLRAEMQRLLAALSRGQFDEAEQVLHADSDHPRSASDLERALQPFVDEHRHLRFDHQARLPEHCFVDELATRHYRLRQVLLDPEGPTEWMIEAEVVVDESFDSGDPILRLVRLGV